MPILKNLATGWTGSVTDGMRRSLLRKRDASGKPVYRDVTPDPPAAPPPEAPPMEAEAPEIDATDAAVRIAEEKGIDLSTVKGTGKDGRITKADVER